MTVGCTQFLSATAETEVINFQLYSQQDISRLKLCVQKLFTNYEGYIDKPLEEFVNKPDSYIPMQPPEVYSTSISLPYVNLSIRIDEGEVKKLKQLVKEVFPKIYYTEVE